MRIRKAIHPERWHTARDVAQQARDLVSADVATHFYARHMSILGRAQELLAREAPTLRVMLSRETLPDEGGERATVLLWCLVVSQ